MPQLSNVSVQWVLPTAACAVPGAPQCPLPVCIWHMSAWAGCFPTYHIPPSSTSRLSPSLLLGFAALCVMVSLLSCLGFLFWKHTRLFLRMIPCFCHGGNSWFVFVLGKQPFSLQESGHCFSDPFCCKATIRTVAGPWWQLSTNVIQAHYLGFFLWKRSRRFLQETHEAHAPATLWGEELWYHFPAEHISQAAPCERCPWPACGQKHIYISLVCTSWRWNLPCLHENHTGHVGPLSCPNPGNSLFPFSFGATCLWTVTTSLCYAN